MSITVDARVVAASDQVSCDVAGETVIMNTESGTFFGLDPVGARVWEVMKHPVTVAEIRDVILREFEVGPERCEADLLDLLRRLEENGLIAVDDEG